MDASFSRRKVLEPAELKALNEKSDYYGALQMASHLGAIVIAGAFHLQMMGSWWVLLSGFVLGVLINFLYAAQHELSHGTVFKTKGINEFFGRLVGFTMIFPRDFDQIMHFAHHQYTQDWKRDGELVREPYTLSTYLLWLFGLTYWRGRIFGVVRRATGKIVEPFITRDEEAKVVLESRLHLVGYAAIAGGSIYFQSWVAVTFWLLPMLLTKPIHQLQNTIEHLGLSHDSDILDNTRSTRTNFIMRWLCWQMPYHTAHHTFPTVPFWKLKQLNAKLEKSVGEVHRMGWIEFQIAAIKKLSQKDESEYPMNEVWVVPLSDGRTLKMQAEG